MKNIRKKVRFHFNLKSKHLLVIMTLFCGSCIVATAASGTTSAPLQNVAGFLVVKPSHDYFQQKISCAF